MTWLRRAFALNTKSLALFRIGMALIILVDIFYRWFDASAFYSDDGVLPRIDYLEKYIHPWKVSLHLASGNSIFIYFCLAVAAFFALGLLIGYRTQVCAFVSWVLMISLQTRNPTILSGADDLMRLMLFWSLFLPLGARFSVDHALSKSKSDEDEVFHWASVAFIMQLLLMYFFTAILKNHPIWNKEGTAILYALQLDIFVTPFGAFLKSFPGLLKIMTFSVLYMELIGPFLFFIPFYKQIFRTSVALLFILFHFGLFLSFYLGAFPWVAIISWVALLPTDFWKGIKFKKPVYCEIYYDPHCPFCLRICLILCEFLGIPSSYIHSANKDPKIDNLMRENNSWCIKSGKNIFQKYEGILFLISQSPIFKFFLPLLKAKPFTSIGDRIYKYVSFNRHLVGKWLKFPSPEQPILKLTLFKSAMVIFCFLLVTAWNINGMGSADDDDKKLPEPFNNIGLFLHLNQKWNMFAPYPFRDDGWYVIEAVLFNGERMDPLQQDHKINFNKPLSVAATVSSAFWRKYLLNLRDRDYSGHWVLFGKYICREWNNRHFHNERINTFKIYYMSEMSSGANQLEPVPDKQFMWRHYCFDKPEDWDESEP